MNFDKFKRILKLAQDEQKIYQAPSLDKFINLSVRLPNGKWSQIKYLEPELKQFYIKKFLGKTGPYDTESMGKMNEMSEALRYLREQSPDDSDIARVLPILEKVLK